MPIHDWTRLDAGVFHHFHHRWMFAISEALNAGCLPAEYYALAEQVAGGLGPDVLALEHARPLRRRNRIAIRHVSGDEVVAIVEIVSPGNKASRHKLRSFVDKAVELLDAGIHLLVLDLFPPTPRDPQGIHAAIWSEIVEDDFQLPADKPLTLVSYAAGEVKRAWIEPVAVGDVLADMPLFLEPEVYVPVPLDAAYRTAFDVFPRRWRDVVEPPGD